jgi:hypothetical protein
LEEHAASIFRARMSVVRIQGNHSDPCEEERREGKRQKERTNRNGEQRMCHNPEDHTLKRRLMNYLEYYILGCNTTRFGRSLATKLHGITSQNIVLFIFTALRTLNKTE